MNLQSYKSFLLLITLSLFSISSCTVEKRVHMAGYSIRFKTKYSSPEYRNISIFKNEESTAICNQKSIQTNELESENKNNEKELHSNTEEKIEEATSFSTNNKNLSNTNVFQKIKKTKSFQPLISKIKLKNKKKFLKNRPDNDMWGFLGDSLLSVLIGLLLLILAGLLIYYLFIILPIATARIVCSILIAIVLILFLFS